MFGGDVASEGSTSGNSDVDSDGSIDDSDFTEEEGEEQEQEGGGGGGEDNGEGQGDKQGQGSGETARCMQRARSTQPSRKLEKNNDGLAGGSKAYPGAATAGSSAKSSETEQAMPTNSSPCSQDTTAAARLPRCKCLVFAQHK